MKNLILLALVALFASSCKEQVTYRGRCLENNSVAEITTELQDTRTYDYYDTVYVNPKTNEIGNMTDTNTIPFVIEPTSPELREEFTRKVAVERQTRKLIGQGYNETQARYIAKVENLIIPEDQVYYSLKQAKPEAQ